MFLLIELPPPTPLRYVEEGDSYVQGSIEP